MYLLCAGPSAENKALWSMWFCPHIGHLRLPLKGTRLIEAPFLSALLLLPQSVAKSAVQPHSSPPITLFGGQASQKEMLRPWPPSRTFHACLELEPSPEASPEEGAGSCPLAWPPLQRAVLTHPYCSQPPAGKSSCKTGRDTSLSQRSLTPTPQKALGGPSSNRGNTKQP